MNSLALENFLARLYSDGALLADFLQRPEAVALAAGLAAPEIGALLAIDREGLSMAAGSFASKRASHESKRSRGWRWRA